MRISDNFSFLRRTNALLVVAGKQAAKIYNVRRGSVEPQAAIKIEPTEYTDKPSAFRNGNSGDVQREDDGYIIQQFLKQLTALLQRVDVPFDRLYLFAPRGIIKKIEAVLPRSLAAKIADEFTGNFLKAHPGELLGRIVSRSKEISAVSTRVRTSKEAEKILRRPKITLAST